MGGWTLTIAPFWCGVICAEAVNVLLLVALAAVVWKRKKPAE